MTDPTSPAFLCAPWIALNQENHARYRALDAVARRAELDRWLFEPSEIVFAAFEPAREVPTVVKGTSLIGFEGSFVTNLDLPDSLAIGRSVSHGFGWFCRASGG